MSNRTPFGERGRAVGFRLKNVERNLDVDGSGPSRREELERIMHRFDGFRLHQVVLNLLSNAFKFTAQGRIDLQLLQRTATHQRLRRGALQGQRVVSHLVRHQHAVFRRGIGRHQHRRSGNRRIDPAGGL